MDAFIQETTRDAGIGLKLAELIDGIGTNEFQPQLARLLYESCGADHCVVFRLVNATINAAMIASVDPQQAKSKIVSSYVEDGLWRKDPVISMVGGAGTQPGSSVVWVNLNDIGYTDLRHTIYSHVQDRVIVFGSRQQVTYGLSVIRHSPRTRFNRAEFSNLADMSNTLVSAVAKHDHFLDRQTNVAHALTSLAEIEHCLEATANMPKREMEVCARALYGMSTLGTALDLNIGEQSVKTYRKRAYVRLQLGGSNELLHWYLMRWSHLHGYPYQTERQLGTARPIAVPGPSFL